MPMRHGRWGAERHRRFLGPRLPFRLTSFDIPDDEAKRRPYFPRTLQDSRTSGFPEIREMGVRFGGTNCYRSVA